MSIATKISEVRRLAAAGRPDAMLQLGWLLVETKQHAEAYKWMALALDRGLEEAIEATEYLEASELVTDAQIRDAYFDIANWCEQGEVVPLNIPAAVRLWEVAQALGHAEAAKRLARWR